MSFIKKGATVHAVLFTTTGELLQERVIKEVYTNTVLFEDGGTHQKYYLREIKNK